MHKTHKGLRVRKTAKKAWSILGWVYTGLIFLVLFTPIIIIVILSFNGNQTRPYVTFTEFSTVWYQKIFESRNTMTAFMNTMIVAFGSTAVSVVIGTLAAVGMHKYNFKGKAVIDALLYVPVVIPEIVSGISLLLLFANASVPRGLISLIISHATFCIPFVVFNVRARLSGYDSSIEEASLDLGANRLKTFVNISIPVLMPGILSGALLAFTLSLDDVIVSYFTHGQTPTFPLMVMDSIKSGVSPGINALSTLILVGTTVFVFVSQSGVFKRNKTRL